MEENFAPVARTRANYYTPGSPVQFVCVELLRGEISGEQAVCLTFRNISRVTLTALEIRFKCKGTDGTVLCEDTFEYRGLEAKPGESFGMDDAVFITGSTIASVDVALKNVYNGKRVVHLEEIKRVRLPAPRRLSPELQQALEERMNRRELKYMPQVFENGWYCSCGAFHPKEEDTVYCSECGCDRILLQNALNILLQPAVAEVGGAELQKKEAEADPAGQTRILDARPYMPERPMRADDAVLDREGTRVIQEELGNAAAMQRAAHPAEPEEQEEAEDERDSIAEALIRWVPPITAVVCAGIALWGFVYYQFIL